MMYYNRLRQIVAKIKLQEKQGRVTSKSGEVGGPLFIG
jgi:hypothetical protein